MRLEVVRRVAMVAVIPVLLALILATPGLMGRPAVLSAIPALIVGLTETHVVIDVHGAVDHYLYRSILLHIQGQDNVSFNRTYTEYDSYDLEVNFSRGTSPAFDVYVLIADRQRNTYALNGTVFTGTDESGDFVSITDRETMRTTVVRTPADVRTLVPRGDGP